MSDTPTPPTGAAELAQRLIRNFNSAPLEGWERPPLYADQGVQLSAGTAARKLGCGFDIVPPGKQSCPYHLHHVQEEMFIVLEGSGTLRVAGERLPIKAGDVIFIPAGPEYPHHILNTSDAPLKYLSISTKEYPEVCEYPDSGKFMAWAWKDGKPTLRQIHKGGGGGEGGLDYWADEP
jgi:uncharacterized cupin superfamily protein